MQCRDVVLWDVAPTRGVHTCLTVVVSDDSVDGEFRRTEPPADTIICVDCGGTAHLITPPPEDGAWYVGDITAYRCGDCRDRWDLVLE